MYFHSSNSNRYKLTRVAFSVFLIVGILNWTIMPNTVAFAEGDAPPAEVVVETPPAPETPPSSETAVSTGDAVSQTETQSDVNTSDVSVDAEAGGQQGEGSTDLNVQNQSEAGVSNTSSTVAETGDNSASGSGDTTVDTGDAAASADVTNIVNTNIVESEGDILVGSGSLDGSSLDLRGSFDGSGDGSSNCDSCLGDISVENQNNATVENNVVVAAGTGENEAGAGGGASITTGDAFAAANVVNIVNTNIVESNYVLLVFNNFGDWSGDLIFPNSDFFRDFFAGFASGCPACGGDINISNDNSANVSSSVGVSANSGENTASGEGADINTGQALASSNVLNQINTNIYNRSSFYLRIKVFGDWNGSIFNLPENIVWGRDSNDIILYDKNDGNPFGEEQSGGGNDISIENTNSASVSNNIQVNASTGGNSASGGTSSVITGNAYAVANEINIVNTNIISSNWTAALVNIFGNWYGNLSFGQPDLWVGTVAESSGILRPGSSVKFITTIKNNGDATASSIRMEARPNSQFLNIGEQNEWFLSPLAAGESVEVEYYGTILGGIPFGWSEMTNKTSVSLQETDGNTKDNTDLITLSVLKRPRKGEKQTLAARTTTYPDLEVIKTHTIPSSIGINGVEMVPFGGSADYKITVINHGGSAFEGILFDQLKDETGKVISNQSWDLGEILSDEEITLTYTTEFTDETSAGTYTNYAWVEALGGSYTYDPALATDADSNIASDKIIVAEKQIVQAQEGPAPEEEEGEVLGMSTEDVSIDRNKLYLEPLGGFCFKGKNEKINSLSVSQSVLLGLSIVLIMQRRKNLPSNLFLI